MSYGVMAVGNALLDHEYLLSDEQLIQTGLTKGNMTLASHEEQSQLLRSIAQQNLSHSKLSGGGSAANSIFAFASLGGRAFYACRVGDDKQGAIYLDDLKKAGVDTSPKAIVKDGVTGSCLVLVTPDGERTMQTYLGTSSQINEENLDFDILKNCNWLYFEGYLAMSETLQEAIVKLRQQAGIHGVKIAVSFADPAVVKFAKDGLQTMLGNGVDLIFCNFEEAQLFTGKKQHKAAAKALTEHCQIAVVTHGAEKTIICQRTDDQLDIIEVPTPQIANLIDSNGAGDNYAGAFLYALSEQYSLAECGRLASEVASRIVQQMGARLPHTRYQEIIKQVLNQY